MAGFASLGDVFNFVSQRAGGCCAPDDIELVMADALIQVRDALGLAEDYVLGQIATAVGVASYDRPAGMLYPKVISFNDCALSNGEAECRCGLTASPEHKGMPERWEMVEDKVVFHPVPDKTYVLKVRGLRTQDVTIKTSGGAWRDVSSVLPAGLGHALAKWTYALAILDSDMGKASAWMNMAQTDLANWKERKLTSAQRFVLGGGSSHHHEEYDSVHSRRGV